MASQPNRKSVWGIWTLNFSNGCLESSVTGYQIPVYEMRDSASILNWIFQISEKTWASPKDLGDLITAIEEILGRNVCSGGKASIIDPKEKLRKYGVNI